jgi:hypothetical protein
MAAVVLDIWKAFHTIWHHGLLYKLYKLKFSISLLKVISSFFLGENSESRLKVKCLRQAGMPQGSVLSPTLYSIYKLYAQTPGVYLGLFADDTCIYATDRKEGYVLRKLQWCLSATETWCERWSTKINEG